MFLRNHNVNPKYIRIISTIASVIARFFFFLYMHADTNIRFITAKEKNSPESMFT